MMKKDTRSGHKGTENLLYTLKRPYVVHTLASGRLITHPTVVLLPNSHCFENYSVTASTWLRVSVTGCDQL